MPTDHYDTLGVPPDADIGAIKKAHRRKAMQHHPDRAGEDPAAREEFDKVQTAYLVLSDPDKRAKYDRGEDPGTGPDNSQSEVMKLAIRAFMEAVQQGDEKFEDMIASARDTLETQSDQADKALQKLAESKKKWVAARERLSRDAAVGPNFLVQSIDAQIRGIDDDHRRITARLGQLREAIELLQGFEYRTDEPERTAYGDPWDHRTDAFAYMMQGMTRSGLHPVRAPFVGGKRFNLAHAAKLIDPEPKD